MSKKPKVTLVANGKTMEVEAEASVFDIYYGSGIMRSTNTQVYSKQMLHVNNLRLPIKDVNAIDLVIGNLKTKDSLSKALGSFLDAIEGK